MTEAVRLGGILRFLFERLFGPIDYPQDQVAVPNKAAARGVLVYVVRTRSGLLALHFAYALQRLGLPVAAMLAGAGMFLWHTVDRLLRLFRQRSERPLGPWRAAFQDRPPTRLEAMVAEAAARGQTIVLALPPPRAVGQKQPPMRNDYVRALLAVQRTTDRPIQLVPHVFTNPALSGSVDHGLTDRLFGDRRHPGRLRHLAMVIAQRRTTVRVAELVDLREFCGDATDDVRLARRVRHVMQRRMREEERVVAGPELPPHHATARHVLRDPVLRAAIAQVAQQTGRSETDLLRRCRQTLRQMAARYNVRYIQFLNAVLSWVFSRIYDGISVDEPGLRQVIDASRRGPVVFCPAHRSHMDYLVLSLMLWQHGITPPHIVAGHNLAFFPMGTIFRGSGAFFIRRSFRDDPLYKEVLAAYVRELIRAGTSIEFFLEGTRSRTGKLLLPKLGMLSMIVDAWRQHAREDVVFVPVSIDYERIIEAGAYARELSGAVKEREGLGALLKTTRVLGSRYGRMLVQFGAPMSLREFALARGLAQDLADEDGWRTQTARLGYRILHDVGHITSVTPTAVVAAVLLSHRRRGLLEADLKSACLGLVDYLDTAAARLSDSLQDVAARPDAVLEAVRQLVHDGLVVVEGAVDAPRYRVPEANRVAVDYYKNALMNLFAPASIVACCLQMRSMLVAHSNGSIASTQLQEDARFVSRLFKREFIYSVDATFDNQFDDALATLAVRGYLDVHDDGRVVVKDPQSLARLGALLRGFVEAYRLTFETLRELRDFPLWEKELIARTQDRCRRAYLAGMIENAEAANTLLIGNAVAWCKENGVLEERPEGRRTVLALTAAYETAALDELVDTLARCGSGSG